jgi:amino acid adenylation domain-containing protein
MIDRENLADLYPLSPLQEGMLYEALRHPQASVHVEQICWHISGAIDAKLFCRAWDELARRHAALRTVMIADKASRPLQAVLRRTTPALDVADLSHLDAATAEQELAEYRIGERAHPPDILGPQLWRVALFTLAPAHHVIVLTFHHILLDGWSLGLLLDDLVAVYAALGAGAAPPAAQWPRFADFIKQIEGVDRAAAQNFFAAELAAAPPRSAIPTLRPPRAGHDEPVNLTRRLSAQTTAALAALARRLAVTQNSLLQALWGLLLMRHIDSDAAVFGNIVSGRPGDLPDAERMVGLCINTIPVVVAAEDGDSFATLAGRVHRRAADAIAFHHLPLTDIPGAADAIGTLFAYENYPDHGAGLATKPFVVERVDSIEEVAWPIALVAVPGEILALTLKYDPRIHDDTEITALADRLEHLLDQALARPDAPLDSLDVLPGAERRKLLAFGLREAPFDAEAGIDDLFVRMVAGQSDALALADGEMRLSYAELDRRVEALAAFLIDIGLPVGARVAVVLDRSAELVIAFLAALRAGAAYLPIDPALPAERIAFMLTDSTPGAVIASAADLARLTLPAGARAIAAGDLPQTPPALRARRPIGGGDVAYVVYTSGSTGAPKGCLVAHRGLVNLFPQLARLMRVGLGRAVAMIHSPSFDASILEMLTALVSGGSLIVASKAVVADAEAFGAFLRAARPQAALITPAHLRLLDPADVGLLATLVSGGEAADAKVLARYCGRLTVLNAYGPSECSVAATCHELTAPPAAGASVPIGRPFANVEVVIVDRRGRLVPPGAPGEILIGGAAPGLGYLDRPELTAERFIAHPLRPGVHIYRTGDLGRWRPDGSIDYLGRCDDQTKIRGFRIEPGEIAARLVAHPAVRDAFVLARDGADGPVLHAYVVAGAEATPEALRAHLSATLPDHMIPAAFVRLDRLPLQHSGKIDRAALPLPAAAPGARTPAVPPPADALAAAVLNIFRDVLGCDDVAMNARFLDSGGHSLAAMRAVSRIRRELKLNLSLVEFFEHETVEALADCLRRKAPDAALPITRAAGEGAGRLLSPAQRRIWFLDQLGSNPAAYVIGGALMLDGELDRGAMETALAALIRRHEGLRTVFPAIDGEPRQVVTEATVTPDWADLTGSDAPEAAAAGAAQALARTPFDLARGPLIRIAIHRLSPRRHLLAFAMHHIISDGWSADVIAQDLAKLYAAERSGTPADLPALPIRLRDAAQWLNEQAAQATAARRYWLAQFAELPPPLQLATDFPRPPVASQVGDEVPVALDRATLDRLAALGGPGTTTFMALVALVKAVLLRHTGQGDNVIGHPIAGRDHPDLEPLVGCFINTLALRDRISPLWSFRRLMEAVRRTTLTAFDHCAFPFDRLIEELQLPRALDRMPLFDVMVLLSPRPPQPIALADLTVTPLELPSAVAKFDLIFDLRETNDGLTGRIAFARDLFLPQTVARLAGHLAVLADGAARDPDAPLAELPLLTAAERQKQLGRPEASPPPECLHHQFARRAAEAPDAVALTCDGVAMSYGELDRAANRLAHRLRALGVGPEVIVGLAMPRGRELLIGLLGILKAGGAYLPLDPVYPDERLAFMRERAGADIIVAGPAEAARLAAPSCQIVTLSPDPTNTSDAPLDDGATPQNLAYVIFTSGSTGEPKGVAVTHGNVARLFTTLRQWLAFDADDRWSLFHSYAFDFSVFEIFGAWLHGGAVVLVPQETARAPDDFLDLLRRERVTVLCQTPSAFLPLIDAEGRAPRAAGTPPLALRHIVFGGETLDPQALRPWIERRGDARPRLSNMYGITETTIHATWHAVTRADLDRRGSPIGRPLPDTRLLILDSHRQLLPAGAIGEIFVGGPSLARGYVGRPDLTAERFITDPFDPENRLYRSGDLASWRADGTLEYHGRIDHQIKLRGFRIELGEIEARLASHPAVQACAVLAPAIAGQPALIAHVALRSPVTPADLRAHLAEFLPDHMLPAQILLHTRLPVTANGKIDRRALPAPEVLAADGEAPHRPPETATEEALAQIWAAVLQRQNIGRDADFFALGGHSLNATQVIARANDCFGVSLRVRIIFEHPVLSDLALAIEDAQLLALGETRLENMLAEIGESGSVSP